MRYEKLQRIYLENICTSDEYTILLLLYSSQILDWKELNFQRQHEKAVSGFKFLNIITNYFLICIKKVQYFHDSETDCFP
jgi:hypothetical protein